MDDPKSALTEILTAGRSKEHIANILQWIGNDVDRISALMDIFFGSHRRMAELAAWAVGDLGYKRPVIMQPWLPQLVEILHNRTVHGSIHRNSLRILIKTDIPDELIEPCAEACFVFLADPKAEVAVRAFSIHVLVNICRKIPELWPELELLLEEHTPHGTPALKNLGRKVLAIMPKH